MEVASEQAQRGPDGAATDALRALTTAANAVAGGRVASALEAIADAAARAASADVAVVRVVEAEAGMAVARAVSAASPLAAAELTGSAAPAAELPDEEVDDPTRAGASLRRTAERLATPYLLQLPVVLDGAPAGSLELLREAGPFDAAERAFARLAAAQVALALRAATREQRDHADARGRVLELAGDALVAAADGTRAGGEIARLVADVTGAAAALVWGVGDDGALTLVSAVGVAGAGSERDRLHELARRALAAGRPVTLDSADAPTALAVATVRLGEPLVGGLQVLYPGDAAPRRAELERLASFGVRAARALRASARSQTLELELERTSALLGVVGEATAQLSLAHTLETAVDRVAELLRAQRLGVYLHDGARLVAAGGRGLVGPHARVAEVLLELALGPFRSRGMLTIDDVRGDRRLSAVADAVEAAGIEAAVAVPLVVHEDVIGLVAVYPERGHAPGANEASLLSALAAQLAVAVQNAQLHERAKRLGTEVEEVLAAEREAARRLGALYEISQAFAQSLSVDVTLEAVARTIVELLEVDAAVIRMPDVRREQLVSRATHVADERLADAARAMLSRPQPFGSSPIQRVFREREPVLVDAEVSAALGGASALLTPFLARGSSAAIVPVATPAEVLAALTIVSFRPDRPITQATVDTAVAIAGQAALAIDNARLYQQQKHFADTMQQALLPQTLPAVRGLEVGAIYAASAHFELGGDVYDYVTLDDGRLAVVLGDVTGHGVDAAADMAMAKYVFRSLARERPEPPEFLAAANEVVVDEIGPGKFITLTYLTIDPETGEVACASAGHPAPRVVQADGVVRALDAHGLALGVDAGQEYREVREILAPREAVVLYTDGVIEARQDGDLFGVERLDALLSRRRALTARDLAAAVVAAARSFAGGELLDDCAVVVIKRAV